MNIEGENTLYGVLDMFTFELLFSEFVDDLLGERDIPGTIWLLHSGLIECVSLKQTGSDRSIAYVDYGGHRRMFLFSYCLLKRRATLSSLSIPGDHPRSI